VINIETTVGNRIDVESERCRFFLFLMQQSIVVAVTTAAHAHADANAQETAHTDADGRNDHAGDVAIHFALFPLGNGQLVIALDRQRKKHTL
jgi:hypothetical protein